MLPPPIDYDSRVTRSVAKVLLGIALALPASAGAAWYGGGALGVTSLGHTVGDFDDGSIVAGRIDDDDFGWKLFGGYRFLPFLGVEAGYVQLAVESDSSPTFSGISDGSGFLYRPGPVTVDIEDPAGFYAAAVGRLPIGTRFAAFGKFGVFNWDADVTTTHLGVVERRGDSGTSTLIGAGFEAKVMPLIRVRAEWESYASVVGGDMDLLSLGVVIGFPFP